MLTSEVDGQEFHVEMLTPEVDCQEFHVEMLTPEVDCQEFHVEMWTPEVDCQEFHVEMLTSFAKSVRKTCVAPRIVYFYAQNFFVRTFFPTFANIIIKYKRL